MAQCRLPFSFNILSRLPPGPRLPGTRKRTRPEEDDGDPPASEQRTVRRRLGDANAVTPKHPPSNGQIHDPAPNVGHQSAPRGHEEGYSSSLAISPPKLDGERPPTLTEVNPDSGSITGGVRIWLKGMDFPALLPLFARFGAAVVPTVGVYPCLSKKYLMLSARRSLLPTFLPVICPLEACQASSMSRYRSTPYQMRRSMEPASRHSNTKGIMMNCESLGHNTGHMLTRIKNLNTSTY